MHLKNQKNSFKYVAFEGIDGCGKSTQAKMFFDYLIAKEFNVFLTREPGGTIAQLRDILLNSNINDKSRLFLFLADRSQTSQLIRDKLKEGIVVTDRSMYSTLAYQGYGLGMDIDMLEKLNIFATDGLKPDIVFLIDIPVHLMAERVKKRDFIESKGVSFFERVRQGYLKLAKDNGFFVIDGTRKKNEIFEEILKIWKGN